MMFKPQDEYNNDMISYYIVTYDKNGWIWLLKGTVSWYPIWNKKWSMLVIC